MQPLLADFGVVLTKLAVLAHHSPPWNEPVPGSKLTPGNPHGNEDQLRTSGISALITVQLGGPRTRCENDPIRGGGADPWARARRVPPVGPLRPTWPAAPTSAACR